MHEPGPVRCTLEPLTVHLPRAEKSTGRPEEARATTLKSGSPNVFRGSGAKAIVWPAFRAATDSTTCGAAPYRPPPGWSYLTSHVPAPLVIVKVAPAFEQAPPLLNVTGSPDVLDAATVKVCL